MSEDIEPSPKGLDYWKVDEGEGRSVTITRHGHGDIEVDIHVVVDKWVDEESIVVAGGHVLLDLTHHQNAQHGRDYQGQDAARARPLHEPRLDLGKRIEFLELHSSFWTPL